MQIIKRVQSYKWLLAVALVVLMLSGVFLYALKARDAEIRRAMETAVEDEAFYMLENLNDRLVFIAKDLLDMHE